MKRTKCLCVAVACMMLGAVSVSAQVKITPEAGISIYKDGVGSSSEKATVSPRLGVSIDYFFNKKASGWGIMSGLHFYQKKDNYSYGEISFLNEKGETLTSPFMPEYGTNVFGYGYGSMAPGEYGNGGWGSIKLDKNKQFQSIENNHVNWRRDYLQLPLLVKYKWQMNDTYSLSFAAGGYVAVGISGTQDTDRITYEVKDNKISNDKTHRGAYETAAYNRLDAGFSSRVSFQSKRLSINLNYETNLNRRSWMGHENLISLTAGYTF